MRANVQGESCCHREPALLPSAASLRNLKVCLVEHVKLTMRSSTICGDLSAASDAPTARLWGSMFWPFVLRFAFWCSLLFLQCIVGLAAIPGSGIVGAGFHDTPMKRFSSQQEICSSSVDLVRVSRVEPQPLAQLQAGWSPDAPQQEAGWVMMGESSRYI